MTKLMEKEAEARSANKAKKRMTKIAIAAACIAVAMLFLNAALTMAVVFLAKDTATGSDGMMTTPSGISVKVENPGFRTVRDPPVPPPLSCHCCSRRRHDPRRCQLYHSRAPPTLCGDFESLCERVFEPVAGHVR